MLRISDEEEEEGEEESSKSDLFSILKARTFTRVIIWFEKTHTIQTIEENHRLTAEIYNSDNMSACVSKTHRSLYAPTDIARACICWLVSAFSFSINMHKKAVCASSPPASPAPPPRSAHKHLWALRAGLTVTAEWFQVRVRYKVHTGARAHTHTHEVFRPTPFNSDLFWIV